MNNNSSLFESSVNQAIQSSLSQNKILLIYLSNETPESVTFGNDYIINNDHLKQALANFVLLKLVENTQEFEFFQQVFQNLRLPSVYAIKNGGIIDIISADEAELTFDAFNARIDQLIASTNNNFIANREENNNTAANAVTPNVENTGNETNDNNNVPETKKANTKKVVKKETTPKKYSTLKEESAEIAAQRYREQLQKQQQQAKTERERILKLVELDREERQKEAAKRKASKSQVEAANEIEDFKEALKENLKRNAHEDDADYLIQLKLFNGHSLKKSFPNSTTLATVRDFINENYPEYQSTPYYFFKPIDRITYSDIDELNKTLKDLKLNRSLIIIKPSDHYGSSSMDLKKNGFKNLANQPSSFSWLRSSVGNVISSIFAGGANAATLAAEARGSSSDEPALSTVSEVVDQSQYSTPVIRSTESTRPSTPKPALTLGDSTNNFSIVSNSSSSANLSEEPNTKDDRLVYNGNQLNLEDDNKNKKEGNLTNNNSKNKNGSGNFTAIGEESHEDNFD